MVGIKSLVLTFAIMLIIVTGSLAFARRAEPSPLMLFVSEQDGLSTLQLLEWETGKTYQGRHSSVTVWYHIVTKNWIYFSPLQDYSLYRMRFDGSRLEKLVSFDFPARFGRLSPDSQWIYYWGFNPDPFELYRMRPDGSQHQNVTRSPADEFLTDWSPDGQWMYIFTNRDGNDELYRMRLDGSGGQNLTRRPGNDSMIGWSADRQWIILENVTDNAVKVYQLSLDGSRQKPLARLAHEYRPVTVTSDGNWLIVGQTDAIANTYGLYRMRLDGSESLLLTADFPDVRYLSTTADAHLVIFEARNELGLADIYSVRLDDGVVQNLTQAPETHPFLRSLSPDGHNMVYSGVVNNDIWLYRVGLDGHNRQVLLHDFNNGMVLGWLPENKQPWHALWLGGLALMIPACMNLLERFRRTARSI